MAASSSTRRKRARPRGFPSRLVVESLQSCPSDDPRYVFWNGACLRTSAVKIWETTFTTLFKKAGIIGGHIHRFRDTFAVRLLEKGVSIETVSILLGHSSIAVTQKHYRPWVRSLQEKLEREVALTWESEGTRECDGPNGAVAVTHD